MLLSVSVTEKSFGSKVLYSDLSLDIQRNEKIGLIGRNGTGKSTLFNIMTGEDKDFSGELEKKSSTVIVSSRQEHHGHEDKTVLEYIQGDLPDYKKLSHIIDTYPDTMGDDPKKLQAFSDALERFGELNYYQVEGEIEQAFASYQLDHQLMHRTLGSLSGGQKRMSELIKVQRSRGDIALIDEPTNHMDYIAKQFFINWLRATDEAVVVITHDRDVLDSVDRIVEIRDGKTYSFRGNYTKYLKTNTGTVSSEVNTYELTQKRIVNLKSDVIRFQRMKEKARNPGTIKRFKSQEMKAREELKKLSEMEKPTFWIDQESASDLNTKLKDSYHKYKATNIKVDARKSGDKDSGSLIKIEGLSLGYGDKTLFEDVSFDLHAGERLRLHGRNGTGKTTIVDAIMATTNKSPLKSDCLAGTITIAPKIKIGLYEQEIKPELLKMKLSQAIEQVMREKGQAIDEQRIKRLLSDYLFNPAVDGEMPVERLSGGQKARLQIISMLINNPQVLILDEPTNHLDLPSIEELENALIDYQGAIIYISHDSFLANKLGGETVLLDT